MVFRACAKVSEGGDWCQQSGWGITIIGGGPAPPLRHSGPLVVDGKLSDRVAMWNRFKQLGIEPMVHCFVAPAWSQKRAQLSCVISVLRRIDGHIRPSYLSIAQAMDASVRLFAVGRLTLKIFN